MNKKITIIGVAIAFFFSGAGIIFAEENNVEPTLISNNDSSVSIEKTALEENQVVKKEVERKKSLLESYKEKIQSFTQKKETQQNKIEERKSEMEAKKEEVLNKVQEKKAVTEENRINIQNKIEVKKEEIKEKLDEKRREQVQKSIENILSRFEKTIEKISEIKTNVQERILSLEAKGFDLTEAKNLNQKVDSQLELAKSKISEMKNSLTEILDSENPKKSLVESKIIIEETRTSIKEAHKSLVEVVRAIKASIIKSKEVPINISNVETNN